MTRKLSSAIIIACAATLSPHFAASETVMNELESQILAKYRGYPPSVLVQILGVPHGTTERDGGEFLTWQITKQSGALVSGVGSVTTRECRATFEFREQKLINASLVGARRKDRTLCRESMRQLLDATPIPLADPAAGSSAATAREVLTNEEIVRLTKAGLPESVIIAKIRASTCKFDLSTEGLIALKRAGVNDTVIQAMAETFSKSK